MWYPMIIFWLACGGFAAFIASQKNRDAVGWFFLGCLFGPVGLIGIAAVPSIPKQDSPEMESGEGEDVIGPPTATEIEDGLTLKQMIVGGAMIIAAFIVIIVIMRFIRE